MSNAERSGAVACISDAHVRRGQRLWCSREEERRGQRWVGENGFDEGWSNFSGSPFEDVCSVNIQRFRSRRIINQSSLAQLLLSFFDKFSDIRTSGSDYSISTYEGRQKSHCFCRSLPPIIEDPFKRMENAARIVRWVELPKISNAFQNAHNKLSSGSVLSDRDSLLSLLTRPFLASKFQIERIEEIFAMSNGKDVLGKSSSTVYAIALLASGQSSAITGFSKHEDEKMAEESHGSINHNHSKSHRVHHQWFLRSRTYHHNLIGTIDIPSPNFIILVFRSNISMVLSFELPFALLSLLKCSSSQTKMGPHKSSIYIIMVSWILGLLRVAINIYFLSTSFVSWLIDSSLPAVANVLISIIVFPLMAVYILAVIYLTFRKETKVTFVDPLNSSHVNIESGGSFQVDGMSRSEVAPVREDRADIPLPD
ncbi:hypothetical protein ZIOFF_001531 [Zingiber officinale]|uniref:Uncharacterized protein n=1 Tax=Zingiber officinale TaxID=94328 RepID=A0A8J5I605_ZINOF|nr:hypothetical protein ZIOFF_001531 [Zingiber officinale]